MLHSGDVLANYVELKVYYRTGNDVLEVGVVEGVGYDTDLKGV